MGIFHERLNELYREARSLDYTIGRKVFAEKLNVTRSQVNAWLDGTANPSYENLIKIAGILGVDYSWLLGERKTRGFLSCAFVGLPPSAEEEYKKLLGYLKKKYQV